MEKLIFPGHIGKLEYIIPALQVYVEADDWVKTADYIEKEFAILKTNGVESEMKDDKTDYTKDAEIPRYFGFVERKTPGDVKSDCRVTDLGKLFYNAVKENNQDGINEAIMTAFETVTFGKNNDGCPGSNTRLEAPNILLIASLMLDGVSRQEYAGILYEMLNNNAPIVTALVKIKMLRDSSSPIKNKVRVDNKVVPFLVNLNFLEEDGSMIKLSNTVKQNFRERISKLPPTNDLENLFPDTVMNIEKFDDAPRQLITYGAPGTGKSYEINTLTKGFSVIRTTFHPDSDYSTFVGAYKPVMEDADVYVVPVVRTSGVDIHEATGKYTEKRISYKFVKQAFLKAYLSAWKKYSEATDKVQPQFLVIEEINRGNCAQIFGDLFQLLDRNDENNFSAYPINSDSDLQQEIKKAFEEDNDYKLDQMLTIDDVVANYQSNYGETLSQDIMNGRVLLLPPNLFIWATMNTSDQSLFPIDSAFKRRWAWNYVKIADAYKKDDEGKFERDENGERIRLAWSIECEGYSCDWWKFIDEINKRISTATSSDDKKLGYFFCKPQKNTTVINAESFVGKVVFYLWNDVFKDNDNSIFNVNPEQKEPSFDAFYTEDEETGRTKPNTSAIKNFLVNVVGEKNVIISKASEDKGDLAQPEQVS